MPINIDQRLHDPVHWLMDEGIESVPPNPDSIVETWLFLANDRAN